MRTDRTEVSVQAKSDNLCTAIPEHLGLFGFTLLTLAWAPIPIGSNRAWSVALLEVAIFALFGVLVLSYTRNPYVMPEIVRRSRLLFILLSLWLLYPLLQLIPLPLHAVEVLGGRSHTPYGELSAFSGADVGFLTVDRGSTFTGFLWQAALVILLFIIVLLVTTPSRVRAVLLVMFAAGFFQATYGLLIYFGGDSLGMWNPGHAPGVVSGTYINQNHFAGLMELTIPIGLGLILWHHEEQQARLQFRRFIGSLLTLTAGQSGLLLFCVLVMSAALMLTASRGAIGGLAIGTTVAVLLAVWKRGFRTREVTLISVAAILLVVGQFWFGSGKLPEKLQSAGLTSHRGDLRDVSYRLIADSPLFGTGVGTYRWVFPGYKDKRFGGNFYEHAHNDFLEVLVEQGFVGCALLFSGLLVLCLRLKRAYAAAQSPLVRGTLFAVVAGGVSILVHGLADFNLQIPANALYFIALLGIGLAACEMKTNAIQS